MHLVAALRDALLERHELIGTRDHRRARVGGPRRWTGRDADRRRTIDLRRRRAAGPPRAGQIDAACIVCAGADSPGCCCTRSCVALGVAGRCARLVRPRRRSVAGLPVGLLCAYALTAAALVTAGLASRSRSGPAAAAAGWLLALLLLSAPRPEGDLVVPGDLLGYAWSLGGAGPRGRRRGRAVAGSLAYRAGGRGPMTRTCPCRASTRRAATSSPPSARVVLRLGGSRYAVDMADVAEVAPLPRVTRVPRHADLAARRGQLAGPGAARCSTSARSSRTASVPLASSARLVVVSRDDLIVGVVAEAVPGVHDGRPGVRGARPAHAAGRRGRPRHRPGRRPGRADRGARRRGRARPARPGRPPPQWVHRLPERRRPAGRGTRSAYSRTGADPMEGGESGASLSGGGPGGVLEEAQRRVGRHARRDGPGRGRWPWCWTRPAAPTSRWPPPRMWLGVGVVSAAGLAALTLFGERLRRRATTSSATATGLVVANVIWVSGLVAVDRRRSSGPTGCSWPPRC